MQKLDDMVKEALAKGFTKVVYRPTDEGWSYYFNSDEGEVIDPDKPGLAIGAAFMEYELDQIVSGNQKVFSSPEEIHVQTKTMSKRLCRQWIEGWYNRIFPRSSTWTR